MEDEIKCSNLSCCSFELSWKAREENVLDSYEYQLDQKEGGDNILTNDLYFNTIYKGKMSNIELMNLKPDTLYTFRLKIIKKGKFDEEKKIIVKTLKTPSAILSEKSVKIANGENINYDNELKDSDKEIISNCSSLIYGKNNENIIEGNFNYITIGLAHDVDNNIYYFSFDILTEYFHIFLKRYIEESENNLIIPCYFIIQNLPTTLILNLLEKGSVIFTGKRMGGVIASSLAFYIIYIGKSKNINYGNAFIKKEKNCLGVVTFGSPSFISNMAIADKMKEFTPYFYHIKEEFDFIPEIIDFINKDQMNKDVFSIFNKMKLNLDDISLYYKFLGIVNFTEENLKKNINNLNKIPFGRYYKMKSSDNSFSLIPINEEKFPEFYFFKIFHSKNQPSGLNIYENFESKIEFNKEALQYLLNKNNQLEFIKIIRRNINDKMKGILKFKLNKTNDDHISFDIIEKIILNSYNNKKYIINNKNIYYDDVDITAFIDNLNEDINDVIICNNFGGEMKVKHIINIQGANGSTKKMLKDNIEKIFFIPYFKLFEIFYESFKNEEKYNKLKEQNFGKDFEELKILKPFETQIKAFNELLFFSRPDILGKSETDFLKKYINKELNENQINSVIDKLKTYYKQSIKVQNDQNINCTNSERDSIAKECFFSSKYK